MVFVPTNNPNDTSDQIIKNIAFYPDIAVAAFRTAVRLQDTITDDRVLEALRSALIDANTELAAWKAVQELAGYATIQDVPSDDHRLDGDVGEYTALTHHYFAAVYSFTKAALLSKYRDSDITPEGAKRADEFENTEEDYRREGRKAISRILGIPVMTVELI